MSPGALVRVWVWGSEAPEPLDMPSPARGHWTYAHYVHWPGPGLGMSPGAGAS